MKRAKTAAEKTWFDKSLEKRMKSPTFAATYRKTRAEIAAREIVLTFTQAELTELARAAGNSTCDPDWIRTWATDKLALLSVAKKIGFEVSR